jgi:hypothetical protein
MIKLTETREITPYVWVHPDDEGEGRATFATSGPVPAANVFQFGESRSDQILA